MPEDDAEALQWYHPAADQGHADAQFELAQAYFVGMGVPHDFVEGRKWMNLLSLQLRNRQIADQKRFKHFTDVLCDLEPEMTPAEIAEAERRAKEWTETFQRRRPPGKAK